jgi:PAS domain S-box-containing protein
MIKVVDNPTRKKNALSLIVGICAVWVISLLIVYLAVKHRALMTRDILVDSILITSMISIAISLFALSRYTVLKERFIQFIAFAFLIGGFIRMTGIIVSDIGVFKVAQQAFYFQLTTWQGGDLLIAFMLAVGTIFVELLPKPKSMFVDVLANVLTALLFISFAVFAYHSHYFPGRFFNGGFHNIALVVSGLFLVSFIGVARNHLKYPTLFNYAISLTLFLLILAGFVGSFSSSITDAASAASTTLLVFAYVLGAIGSMIDVSKIFNEYVRSTERLKVVNKELLKYQLYFEKVPDPVRILDENDLTLYVNPAFERDFGYSLSEIKGRSIYELYEKSEWEKAKEYMRLIEEGKGSEFELVVSTKDGRKIETLLNSSKIVIDGRRIGQITIFRDITKRKQLEYRNQVLSAAVENTDEAIVLTDNSGKITFLNSAAEKLFDCTTDEMQGKVLWEIVSPASGHSYTRDIYAKTLSKGNWKGEVLNRHRDGTEYYISLSMSAIKDKGGEIIAVVGVCENITEKKWQEKKIAITYRVAQLAIENEKISELAESAVRLLSETLSSPLVILYMYDEIEKTIRVEAQYNTLRKSFDLPPTQRISDGVATDAVRAVRLRKIVFTQSVSKTEFVELADELSQSGANGVVSIPLLSSGELVGLLQYVAVAPAANIKYEAELASAAASELAAGIQKLKLNSKIAEQASQLDRIFANASEGIVLVDAGGRILLMNDEGKNILGIKAIPEMEAELDGACWGKLREVFNMHKLDGTPLPEDENPIRRASLEGKNVRGFEFAIMRYGVLRILSISASPLVDTAGAMSGAVAIFSDITDRKKSEERIIYQAMLLDEVNDAIIASDKSGKITSWNPAAERLYGWKAQEVLGLPFDEVVQFGFSGITREKLREELERENFWRGEIVNYSKDGKELNIDSSIAVVRDLNGNPTGSVAINRDITEQKKNELAIRRQNKRLSVINKTALAVKDVLDVGEILNKGITNLSDSEDILAAVAYLLQGRAYEQLDINHDDIRSETMELAASLGFDGSCENNGPAKMLSLSEGVFVDIIRKGEAQIVTDIASLGEVGNAFKRKNISSFIAAPIVGTRKTYGIMLVAAKEGGSFAQIDAEFLTMISRIVGAAVENALLYKDVLEKSKELEDSNEQLSISKTWLEEANAQLVQVNQQLEDASRLKSQFLANMSHELRTPLNSIIGFTNLILTDETQPLTSEQKEGLEIVLRNAKNLLSLINDILDLSKIEAGRMTISPEEFDIAAIVKDALMIVEPLVGNKPVRLLYEIDPSIPLLHSDSSRLKQIVLNLLSNAVKFTDEGHVKVTVRTVENNFISLDVEDTGAGIPAEYLELVFEEFRQLDGSSTRKHGGTGLGLAISRKLAHMLGGDLTVRSEVGKGSTFTLTLPIIYRASESGPGFGTEKQPGVAESQQQNSKVNETTTESSNGQLSPFSSQSPLIVCVDDDSEVLLLLRNHLISEGFEFYGVRDSRYAIEAIRQYKPVLVTLDIMMPHKDGWQILQEMKSDPDLKNIPVVIHTVVDNKALAISLGAESYLMKPVEPDRIISAVRNLTGTNGGDILVVDDNDDFTNFLLNILEKSNFTIYAARNGIEAMEFFSRKRPSLVFLDLLMPEMDGFEVVERMYEDDKLKEIPIVVLTAKEVTEQERSVLNSKIKNIVRKEGLSREIILREVNKFIERKRWTNDKKS